MGEADWRDGKCTESGGVSELAQVSWDQDPSLDVQDKSEGPGLGLEELTGRQAQPHPGSSEEGKGLMEWGWSPMQCGPVSGPLVVLLVFTPPRPVRSQMPVPLTLGYLLQQRRECSLKFNCEDGRLCRNHAFHRKSGKLSRWQVYSILFEVCCDAVQRGSRSHLSLY